MRFQRLVQIPILILFLVLLWLAAYPLPTPWDVDIFLRLDPLVSLGSMAAARAFIPRLAWALVILGIALFLGRLFCGYICPMGATVDFADWLTRKRRKSGRDNAYEASGRWRNLKYLFLAGIGGAALVGVSAVFLFSPLSLITRFYSFVIYPLALMVSNLFLDVFRPVFPHIGLDSLSFTTFSVPRFDTNLFVACLVVAVLTLGLLKPRFWCRNLCPAGAILALFSFKPLIRRRVSEDCTSCGLCLRSCPMGAIGEDFVTTSHAECIACLKCREVCPVNAVSFGVPGRERPLIPAVDLGRRGLLSAGAAGAAAALIAVSNLDHLHEEETPRALRSSGLIRPPGALPETEFQARCVRCGECVRACLTNTLQPVWLESGISGLWTPKITARLAGCEQRCTVCGHVCPTGAIRPLPSSDKIYAKVGTARIVQSRCIAGSRIKSVSSAMKSVHTTPSLPSLHRAARSPFPSSMRTNATAAVIAKANVRSRANRP